MQFGIRQMTFLLLLLAMPVAAYLFVFQPRNDLINEGGNSAEQVKLKQLESATRNIEDLGREIDKLSETIKLFEQKLPTEREVEVVLQQVWELASKHRLTPKSIRTDKSVITSQYAELAIKMEIVGDFDGFYNFLLDLEQLRRITRVPKMELVKNEIQEGQMQADVMLRIFYELQNPSPGDRSRL